jgi:hypothetical protein
VHLPPPVNLKPKRVCPGCRLLKPMNERSCVHCGGRVSEGDLERARKRHARRRRRQMIKAAVILPLVLILLTMLFEQLGF